MISMIVAVSEDWGIGMKNQLLWNIPEDLRRFKKLTTGKAVIMGKKTWESLPRKPLPGRKNIIITDDPRDTFQDSIASFSIEEAISGCDKNEESFVIGGGSIYRQFLPFADRLYITHVHRKAEADTYFPEIKTSEWMIREKEEHPASAEVPVPYTYVIYERLRQL